MFRTLTAVLPGRAECCLNQLSPASDGGEFRDRVRRNILCIAMCKFKCQTFSRSAKEYCVLDTTSKALDSKNDGEFGEYFIRFASFSI